MAVSSVFIDARDVFIRLSLMQGTMLFVPLFLVNLWMSQGCKYSYDLMFFVLFSGRDWMIWENSYGYGRSRWHAAGYEGYGKAS